MPNGEIFPLDHRYKCNCNKINLEYFNISTIFSWLFCRISLWNILRESDGVAIWRISLETNCSEQPQMSRQVPNTIDVNLLLSIANIPKLSVANIPNLSSANIPNLSIANIQVPNAINVNLVLSIANIPQSFVLLGVVVFWDSTQ